MSVLTAFSDKKDLVEAVAELRNEIGSQKTYFLVFFASSKYDSNALASEIAKAFPNVPHIGCTTAGELISGKMSQEAIVAMGFDSEVLKGVRVNVVENMTDPGQNLPTVLADFQNYFGQSLLDLPVEEYVGIILTDGMSLSEEKMMDALGNESNIIFIGGSAGDDLAFQKTYVMANGKAYSNAAALAVLQPTVGYDIIKTQSFKVTDNQLVPTKVNEEIREVLEFNNQPARVAYAQSIGVAPDQANQYFMKHPVGLIADGDPYVRSPQQFKGDNMVFYCSVTEGMELSLLEAGNIIDDTRKALEIQTDAHTAGIINFHCILRTLELREKNLEEPYGQLFKDIPTIGFSTYGEQYIGHINQTSTMLVFKK